MSTQNATSDEDEAGNKPGGMNGLARAKRAAVDGSGALLVGVLVLLASLRARRRGGRAALGGVLGLALIGLGLQQRRKGDEYGDGFENEDEYESSDEDESEERETFETGGGAEIHTDTMEAGTMDIDVDDVTDPGDELNEEQADSEGQSSSRPDDETENDT